MSLFKRNKSPNTVSADAVEAFQFGEFDPKDTALLRSRDVRRHLLIDQIHPWQAEYRVQAYLALNAIAAMNDRMAENMMHAARTQDKDGNNVLPKEVEHFVRDLSDLSIQRMQFAETVISDEELGFEWTDESRNNLFITNLLPDFPEYPDGYEREQPVDRNIQTAGVVTAPFIRGFNAASREVQADTLLLRDELQRSPHATPEEFVDLYDHLTDESPDALISAYAAQDMSDEVDALLSSDTPTLDELSRAYELAFNGYIKTALGMTALCAPRIIIPD